MYTCALLLKSSLKIGGDKSLILCNETDLLLINFHRLTFFHCILF